VAVLGVLNEGQREFLAIADAGGQTLLGMINDLLDISKLESGLLELEYAELDPTALVDEALAAVAQLAADKSLTLLALIEPDLPYLHGDREKLRRVLVNLIGNAVKFTPREGTITITVSIGRDEGEGMVCFAIADTGDGIPAEAFGRIFEKFGQLDKHTQGPKQGTGLGLTFCKMVVEAHGGSIRVESELGLGSTFLFGIPVERPAVVVSSTAVSVSSAALTA
jgi:two-component system sensor histidine kinase/response regulator